MDGHSYPTSLANISQWSRENKTTTHEGNIRFVEYVVLNCIGSNSITQRGMVLKGGNALRFAFQSPRSTTDLDFTVTGDKIPDDGDRLRDLLNDALRFAENRFRIKAKCQRVERRPPPNPDSTRPTYSITIAYQFETDRYFHNFEERNNLPTTIPIEVSFNDRVCETCPWSGDGSVEVQVSSLEDILAEKLRSLLQQKIRNRNRCQDVYDISKYVRQNAINRDKIGRYLQQKAQVRDIEARKASFDDVIREMAALDYDKRITEQAPNNFISFEEAWQDVLSLVESLDIPD